MTESYLYWVAFNRTPGIGPNKMRALLDYFGDVETAWHASPEALAATGLDQRARRALIQLRGTLDLQQLAQNLERHQVRVLTWEDEGYPSRLLEVADAPPVLYCQGEVLPRDSWAVAIVGTRAPTPYGRSATVELARALTQAGVTVVSGMARGVDTIAHQTCLDAGGRTLAVLGCGLDYVYPHENRALAAAIRQHGAVLSDYPLGTSPEGKNFPPRNRIISGLTLATIVVEAGATSGALITAHFAAEQGRDVLAVPGSIFSSQSAGTNQLIRDGAKPILSVGDILAELNLRVVTEYAAVELPATPAEAQLLHHLSAEPLHVDELSILTELPVAQVSSTLAMLELKGRIRQVGTMQFVQARETSTTYSVE